MNDINYFNEIHQIYKKELNIEDIINAIKNNKSIIFIKYGDGEVECMKVIDHLYNEEKYGANCDKDVYFPELSKDLKEGFLYFVEESNRKDIYIGKWHYKNEIKYLSNFYYESGDKNKLIPFVDYHLVMNDTEHLKKNEMYEFVKCIKEKEDSIKIIISNEKNSLLKELFSTNYFVTTPENCTYLVCNEILNNIEKIIKENEDKNIILMTSCGLSAKVIIYKIIKKYEYLNISAFDLGSSFDLLCKKYVTRAYQNEYSYETIYKYYQDLL